METVSYAGWSNCCRLSNDQVDLIVTGDVGPRVIRFGFVGEDNEFKEYADMVGRTGGDAWMIYGGHRLWHAPEGKPRSYFPDNVPVEITRHGAGIRVVQGVETTTGIQKEIDIELSKTDAHATVVHRLRNTNLWAVDLAPWALSVMAQGGKAVIPQPPRGSHEAQLLPTHTLTLWAYTEMNDERWTWGTRYIMLRQDPNNDTQQKVGVSVPDGWTAYARNGHLFVKKYTFVDGADYPDMGSSVETFTNGDMLELETVAPMVTLARDAVVEYVEDWFLFRDVPVPNNDADVDKHILPKVNAARI